MTASARGAAASAATSAGTTPAGRARVDVSKALDLLRGFAAVCMVVNHVAAQMVDPAVVRDQVWWIFMATSAAPVLFFFVSGMAAALRPGTGRWWSRLDTVALLVLADLFFAWQHRAPWGLDFFAFIGLSALCADVVVRSKRAVPLALGLAGALLLLRYGVAPRLALQDGEAPLLAWAVGLPAVDGVSYPLAPWLCYPLFGLALGRWCQQRATPPRLLPVALGLPVAALVCGAGAWAASEHGFAMNRWLTVGAGYFVLSLALIAGAAWLAVLWVRPGARGSDAVRLRGIAAFAVVPVHFGLIALLRAAGVGDLQAAGFAVTAAALVVVSLQASRRFGDLLRRAAPWQWLRPATAATVALCAGVLWAWPVRLAPLASEAVVVLAQLCIAAWMLPRPVARG